MEITFINVINIATKIWTSGLLFINRNGSNQLGDVKFVVFGFVTLRYTFTLI